MDVWRKKMDELAQLEEEILLFDLQEAELKRQLEEARLNLARLADKRFALKQKKRQVAAKKASEDRVATVAREVVALQQKVQQSQDEALARIENAPWKDVAFDWQIQGALSLPERALIGDKRGLGKTLSSIIWFRLQGAKKILVCLRAQVADDFIKELRIREPGLFVYPMISVNAESRRIAATLLSSQKEYVVVTNIESWRRDVDKTVDDLLRLPYEAVILDEAHHIKNRATATAQGFFKIASRVPKVLELTGTPIKNKPQEMFSLLHALYPALFPRESKFLADYCIQVDQNKWKFNPRGLVSLVETIKPFYIARSPEDIGRAVPPPRVITYDLDFSNHPLQGAAYKALAERSLAILQSGKALPVVSQLALMIRQAQITSWPAGIVFDDPETFERVRFDVYESVKADWAVDTLKELVEEGERVIVFSRFKPALYELKARLQKDLSVAVITGDEDRRNTAAIFDDFDLKTASKDAYKYDVLLATYQTVGESANLNAATHMILYDQFWNPGNEDQAIGRIDRVNSLKQATVHVPRVVSTIDTWMASLIEEKRDLVSDFRNASELREAYETQLKKELGKA